MKQYKTLWLLLAMIIVGGFTLTSCVDNQDNPSGDGGSDKDKKYVERLFPVVNTENAPLGTVLLRFYDDMPNVAYISVSHVTNLGDGKYILTNPFGTAKVDTEKDIFTSNDYVAFTNLMGMVQPGLPNIEYDALPIIKWKSVDISPKQVDVTLDYGAFDIDIREDGQNVYFPFTTITNLYTDIFNHMAAFNGLTVMTSPNGFYSLLNG